VLPGGWTTEQEALTYALLRRPLAGLAAAPDEPSRAFCSMLASRACLPVKEHPGLNDCGVEAVQELATLAGTYADLEILVAAPAPALRAALATTLGIPFDAGIPVALRPGSLFAFDWPTGLEAHTRPILVGVDLDWLPAWERGRAHPRYPGGPGAAGTARG